LSPLAFSGPRRALILIITGLLGLAHPDKLAAFRALDLAASKLRFDPHAALNMMGSSPGWLCCRLHHRPARASKRMSAALSAQPLLVAQRLDRVETGGLESGVVAEEDADAAGDQEGD